MSVPHLSMLRGVHIRCLISSTPVAHTFCDDGDDDADDGHVL